MPFQSRVFQLAKDVDRPQECQDSYGIDAARSTAVVADGVASAIFSRNWAAILAEATLAEAPNPEDPQGFARWLDQRRQTWSQRIDARALPWFQKAKLPRGAFSTLLWVQVQPRAENRPGEFGALRLLAFAIGDSCLFHVRHGAVLRTFPLHSAAELENDPLVLGSIDLSRDQLIEFSKLDVLCYGDDLLVLCSDAIAQWALRRQESDDPPPWETYWTMSDAAWRDEILRLRDQRQMRYDDATLVLLRVAEDGAAVGQACANPPRCAEIGRGDRPALPWPRWLKHWRTG